MHCSMVHIIKFGGKRELSHIETDMRHRQTSDRETNKQTNRPTDKAWWKEGVLASLTKFDFKQQVSIRMVTGRLVQKC